MPEEFLRAMVNARHMCCSGYQSRHSNYLKSSLHSHAIEHPIIKYKPEDLIDVAKKQGYDVISVTDHEQVTYTSDLKRRAEDDGILLIPGTEALIGDNNNKKEVLILNITEYPAKEHTSSFENLANWLERYQDRDKLSVGAPHSFYGSSQCLGEDLEKNIELFDFIEYCFFRSPLLRDHPNQKAMKIAEKYNKPILGTGDVHKLWELWTTYSLIESEKKAESVIKTINESTFKDCLIEKQFDNEHGFEKKIITETRNLRLCELYNVAADIIFSRFRNTIDRQN